MAPEEAVVKVMSGLPAAPEFIPDSNDGLSEVGLRDMVLPRLGLCQDNTRARKKTEPEYIPGLEEGDLFNNYSKEIFGKEIHIVPLFFYHSRIMFRDMKEGGGIICQAPDGKQCQMNNGGPCLHSGWGPKGEPPECSEFYNYPSLIYRGPGSRTTEFIVVSLKTTGLDAGRKLNSRMRTRKKASYAGIYKLWSIPSKNKTGQSYFTWDVDNSEVNDGWVDLELYKYAEEMSSAVRAGMAAGTIRVSDEDSDSIDSEV